MSDGASPTGEAGHPAMTDRAARRTAPLTRTAFAFDEHIDGREAGIEPGTECSEAIEGLFGRGERTVLALDAGTYWVEASIVLRGTRSVGIVAKAGGKGDFRGAGGLRSLAAPDRRRRTRPAGGHRRRSARAGRPPRTRGQCGEFVPDRGRRNPRDRRYDRRRFAHAPVCRSGARNRRPSTSVSRRREPFSLLIAPARTDGPRRGSVRRVAGRSASRTVASRSTTPSDLHRGDAESDRGPRFQRPRRRPERDRDPNHRAAGFAGRALLYRRSGRAPRDRHRSGCRTRDDPSTSKRRER